jgi:hypothetical protein
LSAPEATDGAGGRATVREARRVRARSPSLAQHYWWSMIFSENRCPLFGIMLYSAAET